MAITDKDLLTKLHNRDPDVLASIVRQHTASLYKACFGLGFVSTDAEELTQNVWYTFFEILPKFEGNSSVRTFLFGILYNKAKEHRKAQKKYEASENIDEIFDSHFNNQGHWIDSPVNPERFLQSSQTMGLIKKCLELLPMAQKMAFNLKEVEEEKTQEVCNILEVSATNLGVLLFRARNQLRECLESKSK